MCYLPRVVVFKLKQASESPGGWIKTQAAELHPESFWFRGFGVGPRMCIPTHAAGPENDWPRAISSEEFPSYKVQMICVLSLFEWVN